MPATDDRSLTAMLEMDRIAVVGCSATPGKAAHEVPAYLRSHGYEIVPVNPHASEIFGTRSYPSLREVDREVQLVEVFRPTAEVPGIVEEAIHRDDVEALWLQVGIRHNEAARVAEEAGLIVVQDRCMRTEHRRLVGNA